MSEIPLPTNGIKNNLPLPNCVENLPLPLEDDDYNLHVEMDVDFDENLPVEADD